jgi:AAA family ATP:ADP antiporter
MNEYMSGVYSWTGVIAVVIAMLVSGNVIRKFGWTIAALITPIVWVLTSIGFFSGLALEGTTIFEVINTLIANPANLVLLLGSLQICLGRSCKYTLFDKTKEMTFIPLSKDEQRKCKVIVDGLASRFGKSGGSVIYITLFYICGDIAHIVPYIAVIIFIALIAWLYATVRLGGYMSNKIELNESK